MADTKTSKDTQDKCKCGNAVGDLLVRIYRLEDLLGRITLEDAHRHISGHKESANYIYGGANRVAKSCDIDTTAEQNNATEVFNKLESMEIMASSNLLSPTLFYINRNESLNDLSRIRNGIIEKTRDCSR